MLRNMFKTVKERGFSSSSGEAEAPQAPTQRQFLNKNTVNKCFSLLLATTFDLIKLHTCRGLNAIKSKCDSLLGQYTSRRFSGENNIVDSNSESKLNKNRVEFLNVYKDKKRKGGRGRSLLSNTFSSDSEVSADEEELRRFSALGGQGNCYNHRHYLTVEGIKKSASAWVKVDRVLVDWSFNELSRQREEERNVRFYGNNMTRAFITGDNITWVALTSRVILFVLQVIVTNVYGFAKHTNDGYKFTPEVGYGTATDKLVNATFGGLANWDGQYFLHIAVNGYTEENFMAFFPLFPMIVSCFSSLLHFFIGGFVSLSSIVLIIGYIFNIICFVKTAHVLYEIVQHIDEENQEESKLGAAAVVLFCFNPASVFFSSFYTESLFALLTAKSVLAVYKRNILHSTFWAGLSAACRSNGLLNFGFIMSAVLQETLTCNGWRVNYVIILDLIRPIVLTIMSLLPFLLFQVYGVLKFCGKQFQHYEYEPLPAYCTFKTFPYTYVQQKYWNVGFLRYYEIKQLPNFILAAPILYLVVTECWKRLRVLAARSIALRSPRDGFKIYTHIHGIFLAVFCLMNIHVQVSTRLILAAFPYFYVHLAESCRNETILFRNRTIPWPIRSSFVQLWFITYFILGGIAFPLDYPWT